MGSLAHDGTETIDVIYSNHLDMGSELLPHAEEEWFTGRSSFNREGKRLAGYTATSQTQVLEARSLPPGISAQRAKMIAFT